jgi:hypothetical protein
MKLIDRLNQWFRLRLAAIERVSPPGRGVADRTIEGQGEPGRLGGEGGKQRADA